MTGWGDTGPWFNTGEGPPHSHQYQDPCPRLAGATLVMPNAVRPIKAWHWNHPDSPPPRTTSTGVSAPEATQNPAVFLDRIRCATKLN